MRTKLEITFVGSSSSQDCYPLPCTHKQTPQELEIKALELKLAALIVRGDWDEYEKRLTSNYSCIAADGKVAAKEEVMSSFRTGPRKIIFMEPEDLHVWVYGETAIVQGRLTTSHASPAILAPRHTLYPRFCERGPDNRSSWPPSRRQRRKNSTNRAVGGTSNRSAKIKRLL